MTDQVLVAAAKGVTLVGGGPVAPEDFHLAVARAPVIVAADGGMNALHQAGLSPAAVIGDFDSIDPAARACVPPDRLHHIAEQDSTDFHKCLARIEAPLILAVGFTGGRMDHLLAVFNVLVRLPMRRCIVLGPEDLCVLAPPMLELDLPRGTPFSLFPMGPTTAQSTGLNWPLQGLDFAPDGQSGTSNHATGPVRLVSHTPKLLMMLPREYLDRLILGLDRAPRWT